jgi:hypothetical protein
VVLWVIVDTRKFNEKQARNPLTGEWVSVGGMPHLADSRKRLQDAYRARSALLQVGDIRDKGGVISPGDYANVIAFQQHTVSLGSAMRRIGGLSQRDREIRGTLDTIVRRSEVKKDIHVIRGVADPRVTFGSAWDDDDDNTGLVWRDEAFVPATIHINVAEQIASDRAGQTGGRQALMHILVPKGNKAANLNTGEYYHHGEVLINRGSTFRIIKDHGKPKSGPRILDVEVIPENVVRQQMQDWLLVANSPEIPDINMKFPEWPKVPIMAEAKSKRSVDAGIDGERELQPDEWDERFVDRGEPVAVLRPPGERTHRDDLELRHRILRALGVLDERNWKDQPRDPGGEDGGQWTEGGASGAVSAGASAAAKMVQALSKIEDDLEHDRDTEVTPDMLPSLMSSLRGKDASNLAHLNVTGKGNKNLFTEHIREIPRDQMPQLPTNLTDLQLFADRLGAMGVTAEVVQMDPRDLVMTQNQLDSKKVAKLYGFMSDGGWQEGGVILASREGAVVDGHHRWAAASAVAASGARPDFKITVLKIDMPIDDLLKFANTMSGPRVGLGTEN